MVKNYLSMNNLIFKVHLLKKLYYEDNNDKDNL